ncbi:MAG: hypothetical protein HN658_07830 [Rhodospirillales bacterium]|jgi:quercetin dioxygenase-like cupin family protein|nr:hypothetical protein [Rhodospirillales bacterium]MBT4005691.1 hypothetical protein [Rhodospirillales bacterium]MBT5075036.1 hypothetical protein [Rhodospirillales bacterium]MBT5113346.1 hypothetical protein [Rhodospirillales bacterium]MBT5672172.1 hypothetical protein [Rhodospirillales bacterium]
MADVAPSEASVPGEEEAHKDAENRIQSFKYTKPEDFEATKGIIRLCHSDILQGLVQVIKSGGENNLHFHEGMDTYWMVLKGRAAFYGPGDTLIAEYGPMEGLMMPREARYWFAKASDDEDLELLQIICYEDNINNTKRINTSKRKIPAGATPWFDATEDNAILDRSKRADINDR